jgi:hypothetical protein
MTAREQQQKKCAVLQKHGDVALFPDRMKNIPSIF